MSVQDLGASSNWKQVSDDLFILKSKSAVKIRKTHDYSVKYVFTASAIFVKKMGGATNESENSSWTAALASRMFKVYLDVYLQ